MWGRGEEYIEKECKLLKGKQALLLNFGQTVTSKGIM